MNNNIFLFTLFLFHPLYSGNSSSQSSNKKDISTLNSTQKKPQTSPVIENKSFKKHELFSFDKFLGQTSTSSLEASTTNISPEDIADDLYYEAFTLPPDRLSRKHSTESNTKELPAESLPKVTYESKEKPQLLVQKSAPLVTAHKTSKVDSIDEKLES